MCDSAHLVRKLVDLEHISAHAEEDVFQKSRQDSVRLEEKFRQ